MALALLISKSRTCPQGPPRPGILPEGPPDRGPTAADDSRATDYQHRFCFAVSAIVTMLTCLVRCLPPTRKVRCREQGHVEPQVEAQCRSGSRLSADPTTFHLAVKWPSSQGSPNSAAAGCRRS
jgi:hypothetical protein